MDIPRTMVALLAIGGAFLPACRDPNKRQADEDHAPGPPTAQITVWENGYEAFVEHEYPVANVPVRFITHISEIATGEPRREGPITFVLGGPSGSSTRYTVERVARDGIYLPSLTFPESGVWMVTVELPGTPSPAEIHLGDIRVYPSADDALHAPAPEESDGVSFLKEQQWKFSMRTLPAARRTLVDRRKFPGRVRAKRGRRVAVASPATGRLITPPNVAMIEIGDQVGEGDLLALVEPTLASSEHLALEVKLAQAEAEEIRAAQALELAEATLSRNERLESANAKSKRELERARYELEAAKAAHSAAVAIKMRYEKAKSLARRFGTQGDDAPTGEFGPVELKAPIAGSVVQVEKSPGERVGPELDLFVILDASIVVVEVSVPEYDVSDVGVSPTAYVELRSEAGATLRLDLNLRHAGLEVDPQTRTVPFLYDVENPDGRLRVGMALDVFLETKQATEVVALPESALVDEDTAYIAFVQLAGETFEKRQLTLGVRDRGLVEIVDGIAEGERVVTTDPWAIRIASLSTVIPAHGHAH